MMINYVGPQKKGKKQSWNVQITVSFSKVHQMFETDQKETGTDGHPADPPEPTRIETQHELDVVAETVGTYRST